MIEADAVYRALRQFNVSLPQKEKVMNQFPTSALAAAAPEMQVPTCLKQLEHAITSLEGTRDHMLNRLDPVSRNELIPGLVKGTSDDLVPLAGEIRSLTQRVEGIAETLLNAINRLEI
jgi:hypothetical protein